MEQGLRIGRCVIIMLHFAEIKIVNPTFDLRLFQQLLAVVVQNCVVVFTSVWHIQFQMRELCFNLMLRAVPVLDDVRVVEGFGRGGRLQQQVLSVLFTERAIHQDIAVVESSHGHGAIVVGIVIRWPKSISRGLVPLISRRRLVIRDERR